MNTLLTIAIAVPVGIVALYFIIVGALYAFAVGFAKFGVGHPVKEIVPHPETGEPIVVEGVLRFESRLSLLIWALSGHKYAQCMGWLVKGVMRIVVCIADLDIDGETFYHELVIHGRQWARYRYRMPFLQGRALLLRGYRNSKFEVSAYRGGKMWGHLAPSYRLLPPTTRNPHGVLERTFKNKEAREKWEELYGLRPPKAA